MILLGGSSMHKGSNGWVRGACGQLSAGADGFWEGLGCRCFATTFPFTGLVRVERKGSVFTWVADVRERRSLHISCLHDHHPTFLNLAALMLATCDFLDCIAMLIEALEIPAFRDQLHLIQSVIGNQDRDERGTILHGEAYAANSLPSRVPNW